MALPNDTGPNGATPATSQHAIDAELADWIYHRATADQGLGLDEIETGARIYSGPISATLKLQGYTIGPEGFIYNTKTGFCYAVVDESRGNYAIVVRGTDFGSGSSSDLFTAVLQSLAGDPSKLTLTSKLDARDIYQDVWQGEGLYGQATQVQDVLNVVAALKSAQSGANIRLVGQSLGGGDAGAAAVAAGLQSDIFDPAPFRNEADVQILLAAAASVGVTDFSPNAARTVASAYLNAYGVNGSGTTIGLQVYNEVGIVGWAKFFAKYECLYSALTTATGHNITRIDGEFLSSAPFTFSEGVGVEKLVGSETSYDVGYTANGGITNGLLDGSFLTYHRRSPA